MESKNEEIRFLVQRGNYDDAMILLRELPDSLFKIHQFSIIYERIGENKLSETYAHQLLEYAKQEQNEEYQIRAYISLGYAYWRIDEIKTAIQYVELGLENIKSIELERSMKLKLQADLNYIRGILYSREGLMKESKNEFFKSYELRKEIQDQIGISHSLNALGVATELLGDIQNSLKYHKEALSIKREIGNLQDISRSLVNIGIILQNQGRHEEALSFYLEGLDIAQKVGNINDIASFHSSIGAIYSLYKDLHQAENQFKLAFDLNKEINNEFNLVKNISSLIYVELARDKIDYDKIEDYFTQIKKLSGNKDDLILKQYVLLTEAAILGSKSRMKHKSKAQKIYENLIKNNQLRHDFKVRSIQELVALLIEELKNHQDDDLESEISGYLDELKRIAKEENSTLLEIKVLRMQSQFLMLQSKFKDSRNALTDAQLLADEIGLDHIAKAISEEFDQFMLNEFNIFKEEYNETTTTLRENKFVDFEDLVASFLQTHKEEDEDDEERPDLILLLDEGGLIRYSFNFHSEKTLSHQLMASFITALNSFGGQIMGSGDLERVKFKDFSFVVKSIGKLTLCYIFKGQSYFAIRKFKKLYLAFAESEDTMKKILRTGMELPKETKEGFDEIVKKIM